MSVRQSAADRECDKCHRENRPCDAETFDECPRRGRAEMAADDEYTRRKEEAH